MTALVSEPTGSMDRKLIELLEDKCTAHFSDQLDAIEVEALEKCAPDATLMMIRVARDTIEFAERIAAGRYRL